MAEIEYFYAPHSVFAYLGATRLSEIAQATGRKIVHRPVTLNEVVEVHHAQGFKGRSKAHYPYFFGREIERWGEYRDVPFKGGVPSNHANDTSLASRILIAATQQDQGADRLSHAMMQAHWRDHGDLADQAMLKGLIDAVGMEMEMCFMARIGWKWWNARLQNLSRGSGPNWSQASGRTDRRPLPLGSALCFGHYPPCSHAMDNAASAINNQDIGF